MVCVSFHGPAAPPRTPPTLDDAQAGALAAILAGRGPVLVSGGPGSGKTEVLVRSVAGLVSSGVGLERLVVLSHSRPAAQRLRRRLMATLRGAFFSPVITTVHGWCARLVARHGVPGWEGGRSVRLLSAPEQDFRVRELIDELGPQAWPPDLRRASRTAAFATQLRGLVTRARQCGLDPVGLAALGRATHRAAWEAAGAFFAAYLDATDAEGVLDYAELVHRSRLLASQADVAAALRAEVRAVLVDELAEFDPAQWALLGDVWTAGVPVVGLVDPDTSVFGFRGAQASPLARFEHLFGTAPGVSRFHLAGNHRQARAVAAACGRLYDAPIPSAAGERGAEPGRVDVWLADSPSARDGALAAYLRAAHQELDVPWGQMAVLGQAEGTDLAGLALGLSAHGIPVRHDGDQVGLVQTPAVRQFLPVLDLVEAWAQGRVPGPGVVAAALASRLAGLDAVALRAVARELGDERPQAAVDAFLAGPGLGTAPGGALGPGGGLRRDCQGALEPFWALRAAWAAAAAELRAGGDVGRLLWQVWSNARWPDQARADALGGGLAASQANADLNAVVALFDLAGEEASWRGSTGLRGFRARLDQYLIGSDTAREADPRDRGVQVMSLRAAKGRGWALAVVVGAAEGRWPGPANLGDVFEAEALGAHPDGAVSADGLVGAAGQWRRAELRAFLLACSRAERRLLVIGDAGQVAEPVQPSRFARRLGVPPVGVAAGEEPPDTLDGLVARLRRASLDERLAPARREAAVALLGWLAAQRDETGRPVAAAADPATWWGLAEPGPAVAPGGPGSAVTAVAPVRLASSAVGALLVCPRRWFLARRTLGDARAGPSAALGTIMHRVFQRDADGALGAAGVAALLDDGWPALAAEVPWQAEHLRREATAMYERFVRWRDGRPGRALVATEAGFALALELDGLLVEIHGSVDRLERDAEGRWVVVDFKTGARPDLAANRDQLALYELAVREGRFEDLALAAALAASGRVTGPPELVWPRVPAGAREPGHPRVEAAPSLAARPHDAALEFDAPEYPTWAHARVAAAARIVASGRFDARAGQPCRTCAFRQGCPGLARHDGAED